MRWRKETALNRNEASHQTMRTRKEEDEEEEQETKRHTVSLSLSTYSLPPHICILILQSLRKKALTVCCVLGTPQGSEDLFLQWCVGKPSFLGSCVLGSPSGNKTPVVHTHIPDGIFFVLSVLNLLNSVQSFEKI